MNLKRIIWLILLASLILSIGFVSATDVNDTIDDIVTQSSGIDLTNINEDDNLEISRDAQISSQENSSRVIYVGQNRTTDGGNGTSENPFGSFELACSNLSGEEKVEINVYNGTYYLDSNLKFNTSNLFIKGMGSVIIKNLENKDGGHASFGLTSSLGNFTFNNLVFDGSNCTSLSSLSPNKPYFHVFAGTANLGILYNCTFIGFNDNVMFPCQFNRKFVRCNFLDTYNIISNSYWYNGLIIDFEYCIFSNEIGWGITPLNPAKLNITYNKIWFGSNSISKYVQYQTLDYNNVYTYEKANIINYAMFSAYEKYLGNNTYQIIGNLIWNDSTIDGIELLNPMKIKISSRTGEIVREIVLKNGTFNVTYNSMSKENHVEIELDSEEVILEFNNGIQVVANPIYYGDEQKITINLPISVNSIVNITVNNKTYEVKSNGASKFNFTVPDELIEGIYQVDVSIIDYQNHVYGFNSTNWTISKINKNIVIKTPANAHINDESINISVLLDWDATGNITVFANDKNITHECYGRTININISSLLVGGENEITVIYSGNKKYTNQTKAEKLFVNRMYPNMNISIPSNSIIDDNINITVLIPFNTSGNLTVFANNKNITFNNISNENIIDISKLLMVGFNMVSVKYSGDNLWDSQTKKEIIYVDKIKPNMSITLTQNIVKIGENIEILVNLHEEALGNLSINFNQKNYLFNVMGKYTYINISSLILGINEINITYNGDQKHYSQSQTTKILVEKYDISLNNIQLTITNHTTPSFLIRLPSNVTGNITVVINDKTYIQILVNGSAYLKIVDLIPGEYNTIITYNGNYKFNQFTISDKFYVPKPILKANDINMIYTSGSQYSVQVTASGNPVIGKIINIKINGKKTKVITNSKGYASVRINLPPKSTKYIITAEYQGVTITNKVKINSIIKARNLKVKKSANSFKIRITLKKVDKKYLKGKKITLKFKGKKYSTKTNKKGVVIFKINKNILKKLKVGKKYEYQVNYLKDSVSKKIIIKK